MIIWHQLTRILQWYAEPLVCDELELHKDPIQSLPPES